MDATAYFRYAAVRYAPWSSADCPFEVVGNSTKQVGIVQLNLEEAKDLHHALGLLIATRSVEVR